MKAASQRPPAWIASSTSGASTAAERIRVISKGTGVLQRFRRRAVASLAPTEFRDGGFEVALVEVGPQRSEEHTSELQSLMRISYAVFCLKKNNNQTKTPLQHNHRNTSH